MWHIEVAHLYNHVFLFLLQINDSMAFIVFPMKYHIPYHKQQMCTTV